MLRCGVCVIRFRIPWLKIAWRPEDASINCEAIILKWLWEAFEQYITCKVPPNSPVKLPWFGVKAMIDDRFYGSMILKSLGGPPSHVMPGSSKFCLGSSMARHVSGSRGLRPRYVVESFFGMFRWNREFEWILNLQKHTKTHQPQQPHHNHFDKFSSDFVPRKPCRNLPSTSTKTSPRSMARLKLRCCHDCCWSRTLLIFWWLLYWGVCLFSFWFVASKASRKRQLNNLES